MRARLVFAGLVAAAGVLGALAHELGHCVFYWVQGVPAVMSLTKEYPLRDLTDAQYAWGSLGGPVASLLLLVLAVRWHARTDPGGSRRRWASALVLAATFYFVLRGLIAVLSRRGGELDDAAGLLGLDYRAVVVLYTVIVVGALWAWLRSEGAAPSWRAAGAFAGLLVVFTITMVLLQTVDERLFRERFPTVRIGDDRLYNEHRGD